jgi:predicted alpha/beta-hydrolase family hydrolase
VACRTAAAVGAHAVLALAFPLHPPGRPDRSRLAELDLPSAAGLPVLVLQGTRDAFGGPADIPPAPGRTVVPVDGADHGFRAGAAPDRAGPTRQVVSAVSAWLADVLPVSGESSSGPRG